VEAVTYAENVIRDAGIPLGGAALTPEQTRALMSRGYRLLWHQFDVLILKQFVRQTAAWRAGRASGPGGVMSLVDRPTRERHARSSA
jgi:hypothetical protein